MNFRNRRGITGADVAAAITVIVLTVGIVTAIYVNTINKSKDNVRYANAVRIATNIMENIQKKPYEYVTAICKTNGDNYVEVTGSADAKVFDTKIPNGFKVKVIATPGGTNYDIARDITIDVTYRGNSAYKTISISSVKEKELMDMTNSPDISTIPGYKPFYKDTETKYYFYPITVSGTNYTVTTLSDINWYDYESGKYALIYKSSTGTINVGATGTIDSIKSNIYVWIPRFVSTNSGEGTDTVQFLYGTSDYAITFNTYGTLFAYGVSYSGTVGADSTPVTYNSETYSYTNSNFAQGDGLKGVWYHLGTTYANTDSIYLNAKSLNDRIAFSSTTSITLPKTTP